MRDALSWFANRAVDGMGSPWGVGAFMVLCIAGHVWLTVTGAISGLSNHYLVGLSEAAIIMAACILHAGIIDARALHLKIDSLAIANPNVPNAVAGSESLPEVEIKRLKSEALSQVKETVVEAVNEESQE